MTEFLEAKKLINDSETVLIAAHQDPDGDAFGSMLALKSAFAKEGKKIAVYSPSPLHEGWNFLPDFKEIFARVELALKHVNAPEPDLIIGVDYGSPRRLALENIKYKKFLTFDHHSVCRPLEGLKIIDENASSTSEIIYNFFQICGIAIDFQIATCLLAGIYSDTNGFRHANTRAQTLKAAGHLLSKGAPLQKIARAENSYFSQSEINLWNSAFEKIQIDSKNGILFSLVTQKDCPDLNSKSKSSMIASLLSTVPEAKFALICTEKEKGKIECSLRSQKNRDVNVASIAKIFGGGGHCLAAGFQSDAAPEEILARVKNFVAENLYSAEKEV